jgi:hypothetical protein
VSSKAKANSSGAMKQRSGGSTGAEGRGQDLVVELSCKPIT